MEPLSIRMHIRHINVSSLVYIYVAEKVLERKGYAKEMHKFIT